MKMCKAVSFLALLITLIFEVVSDDDSIQLNTLTTAKLRSSTSPKPSTLYRRINVKRKLDNGSNSLLNIIKLLNRHRKEGNKTLDIRKWDRWCQLQPKKGNCSKTLNRYYYDSLLDRCIKFIYSGCDGNKNNFNTFDECKRRCDGASYNHIDDTTVPTFCLLQPNTGYCLALMTRYYYDVSSKTCKEFIYGGCGGNQNRFDTKHSCMKMCSAF